MRGGRTTNEIEVIIRARDEASGPLGQFSQNVQGIGQIALVGFGAAATAVAGLGAALADLAVDAAPLQNISAAFETFAADVGSGADEMLSALQQASSGMVTNRELMQNFNLASQLVSREFAAALPDAMQYLGRVSAATGEDMNFLMNSLIRGVGRLSPMILDNLGIQVDLNQAMEDYAAANNLSVESMTRQQQQMALANAVTTALANNVGNLPALAGTAQQAFANLGVQFQNLRDDVGLAVLPVFERLVEAVGDEILPAFTDFIRNGAERLADALMPVVDFVVDLVQGFYSAYEATGSFENAIGDVIDQFDGMGNVWNILNGIKNAIETVVNALSPIIRAIINWVGENIELQDVLIAIGVAIAAVVVPAIVSFLAALAPIVGTFLLLVGVAALLRRAWETNFLGIRDFILNSVIPALQTLWEWLVANVPSAIATLASVWQGTLLPALQTAWNWIQTSLIPALQTLWEFLATNIPAAVATVSTTWTGTLLPAIQAVWMWLQTNLFPIFTQLAALLQGGFSNAIAVFGALWQGVLLPALQAVQPVIQAIWGFLQQLANLLMGNLQSGAALMASLWQTVLLPALTAVWNFLSTSIFPLFQAIGNLIGAVLNVALTAMAGIWQNLLLPALTAVYNWLAANIIPAFQEVASTAQGVLGPIIEWLAENVIPPLSAAFAAIGSAIQDVIGFINGLTNAINNIELPDWLQPGSPTPFELGLRGITDALATLNRQGLPQLSAGLALSSPTLPALTPAMAGGGGGGGTTTLNMNLTVNTPAVDTFQISSLFDQIEAEAARRGISVRGQRGVAT